MQHCCLKGFIVEFVFVFTFLIVVISQFKMLNFQKLVKRIGRRDSAKDDQPSFQQILVINNVDVYEKRNRWIFRSNNKVVTQIYPLFFPVIVALLFWFGRFFFSFLIISSADFTGMQIAEDKLDSFLGIVAWF